MSDSPSLRYLIVPGLHDSGPAHWQSHWQAQLGAHRVIQADWHQLQLESWAERIADGIQASPGPVMLVAHSFGCLASVHALNSRALNVSGALLVAPANPRKFGLPETALSAPLPCPSILVASDNDPWLALDAARRLAQHWGSRLHNLGAAGHINASSGYGPWPEGLNLLRQLVRSAQRRNPSGIPLRKLTGTLSLQCRRPVWPASQPVRFDQVLFSY